jgi:predicted RNA binding protein YcfA (HicA-like mRNA interferase family)
MPRLRRLSGAAIVKILEGFGFEVIGIKGSHHKLRRVIAEQKQTLHVPVHGRKPLPTGTLHTIYKEACAYIPEDALYSHFYTD